MSAGGGFVLRNLSGDLRRVRLLLNLREGMRTKVFMPSSGFRELPNRNPLRKGKPRDEINRERRRTWGLGRIGLGYADNRCVAGMGDGVCAGDCTGTI